MKKYKGNIKDLKKISFDKKCEIIMDIVNGLDSIHSINIIHSDLKCDNVLYEYDSKEERYKGYIADFGGSNNIGKELEVCTPAFWPHKYNDILIRENDIYSLGKTILEFFGIDDLETLKEINYNNFPQIVPLAIFNYNNNLYNLVRKSLRQIPGERPSLDDYFDTLLDILNLL